MSGGDGIIGKTLGKCRILGRLGYGKTASIFRAWYEPLGKEVAVKILKEDMKASEELRQKFLNEARALAKLDHGNIVKVFDVVEEGGYLFIVMELLKGRDVWQILKEDGPLEAPKAVAIAIGIARALETAHREGIVHRDVKPSNIMVVGRREDPKLLDFGLATEGVTSGRAGTPHYMSPEQIQGKRIDEKSDIYSLGATLYHMLTGKPPYSGDTPKEIMEAHLAGDLRLPSKAGRDLDVPKALDPIVKRMMTPVPGYRYSAKDLAAELEGAKLTGGRRRPAAHEGRGAARRKANTPLILGAAGVVALIVVLVVVLLVTSGGKRKPGPAAGPDGTPTAGGEIVPLNVPAAGNLPPPPVQSEGEKAYNLARSFATNHTGQWDTIIAEYEKVWNAHRDDEWGEKARQKMREVDMQREAIRRAEEESARIRARQRAEGDLKIGLDAALKEYEFAKARKIIDDYQLEWGEDDAIALRGRYMEFADQMITNLAEEITLNQRKAKLSTYKTGAAEGATIESADPERVTIKEGDLERREPWSIFAPKDLARLAGRMLSSRDPMNYCLIHSFLNAMGFPEDAEDVIRNGELVDRAGKIDEYRRRLKGN